MSIAVGKVSYLLAIRPEKERHRLICVSPEDTAQNAARLMEQENVSSVLVGSADNPVGILTERDFVLGLVVPNLTARLAQVKEIMTRGPLETVTEETLLSEARRILKEEHIRHLAVVRGGQVITIISEREMMEAFYNYGWDLENYIRGYAMPST